MNQNNIYMYIDDGKINIDKVADDFSGYLWRVVENSGIVDKNDIKDIISDTYLILWNNQEKLDGNKPLSPYLVGITKNLIKRYFSKMSRQVVETNIEDFENLLLENEGIEYGLERKEIQTTILDILKGEDKDIFIDFYFEEKSVKQIALENNYTESKVKTKLHRLRKHIKEELLKGGYNING